MVKDTHVKVKVNVDLYSAS